MIFDTLFGEGRTIATESTINPEIAGITMDSVEECAGDPFEFATAIMYENEMAMNNLDLAVMCCEYAYLKENGTEMVYEAGVLKNFIDGAKKKVKEWWGKIVSFFKKVFNYVANFVRTDEQFVKKYEAAAKKAGTVKGLNLKGYNYDIAVPAMMMRVINDELSLAQIEDGDHDNDKIEKDLDIIRGKVCLYRGKPVLASEFTKELNKVLKGGSDEKEMISVWDCSKAIEEIKNAKKTKEALQKLFDKSKALANKATSELTTIETVAIKAEKADPNSKEKQIASQAAHNAVKLVSSMLSIATMINNQGSKMITANNRQNRAFTTKALSKSDRDAADAKTLSESASYDDMSMSVLFDI